MSKSYIANKFIEKNKYPPLRYHDLQAGQMFMYNNGDTYYMKLSTGGIVNLRHGDVYTSINEDGAVRLVHELTISDAQDC